MSQNEELASRLKKIRLSLKLKQKELSASLGVSAPSYSEIENGKYKPGYEFLKKIAEKHNVNLYYLIFGQGEMFGGLCEKCPAGVNDNFLVNDQEMNKFFHYFTKSAIVQYKIMAYFHSLFLTDKEMIDSDMKEVEP